MLLTQLQPRLCVAPRAIHLEAIADDARILQQHLQLLIALGGHKLHIKIAIQGAVVSPLTQHGNPRQTRLKAFQHKHFKQIICLVAGYAPLLIVVLLV